MTFEEFKEYFEEQAPVVLVELAREWERNPELMKMWLDNAMNSNQLFLPSHWLTSLLSWHGTERGYNWWRILAIRHGGEYYPGNKIN